MRTPISLTAAGDEWVVSVDGYQIHFFNEASARAFIERHEQRTIPENELFQAGSAQMEMNLGDK